MEMASWQLSEKQEDWKPNDSLMHCTFEARIKEKRLLNGLLAIQYYLD